MWIDSIVVMVNLMQARLMLAVFLLVLVCVVLVIKYARADFTGAWEAYEQGQYNIAVREFLRCAERGHDKCQLYLGDIYSYGHGTIVRKDKALEWYLKSARQKNSSAAGRLSSWYVHNLGGEEGRVKSYMWFKIAKALGEGLSVKLEARLRKAMTEEEIQQAQRLATEWWLKHQ